MGVGQRFWTDQERGFRYAQTLGNAHDPIARCRCGHLVHWGVVGDSFYVWGRQDKCLIWKQISSRYVVSTWLDFFLRCWTALERWLFMLCVLPLKNNPSSISCLLPRLSTFTVQSAVSIKTIEWKKQQVATNHCSWVFVLVGLLFSFSPAGRDVFQKHFSGKAFNSFKTCIYRMVSVKIVVPFWRWTPVPWQNLFPGIAWTSSEVDKEFSIIPISVVRMVCS